MVRVVGSNTLEPFAAAASGCSARDLNSVRGQGSLYLRLKAATAAQVWTICAVLAYFTAIVASIASGLVKFRRFFPLGLTLE